MAYDTDDLLYLMRRLRDPKDGCPWDLKQSYATIAPSTLEEAYEVVDTIERGDLDHLQEELGDLLFQVIFYSQLAQEDLRFDFHDVVSGLVTKLVRRHPHVFPDGSLQSRASSTEDNPTQVKQRWETLKQQERSAKGVEGLLDDVPLNLPALSRAAKLQKRAASVGFDWPQVDGPIAKVREELQELEQALADDDPQAVAEELGDLLFAAVNISRSLKIDPEAALRAGNRKFERRFRHMEANSDQPLAELSLEQLEVLWETAKSSSD